MSQDVAEKSNKGKEITISQLRELVESLPERTIIRVEFAEGTGEKDGSGEAVLS